MRKKNPSFDFQQYGQIETNRDKYIGKRGFAMEIPFFFPSFGGRLIGKRTLSIQNRLQSWREEAETDPA